MKNGKITIARNGAILGEYDRDQAADMLDTGHLLRSDHYYNEVRAEWTLLSGLTSASLPSPPPILSAARVSSPLEFKPTSERSPAEYPGSKSSKRGKSSDKSRAKKRGDFALAGWIACLFALGAIAGMWAWAENLNTQLTASDEKLRGLGEKIEVLKREKQLLTEITPRGRVRGIITYEPSSNQVAIMNGATVGLYRRADVEKALATATEPVGESFDNTVERLKSAIGPPLEVSLTDSNGRIDIAVAEPGQYVLVASAAKSTSGGVDRYFWLIGFSDTSQPSNLILLNESNSLSAAKPRFAITDVQSMSAGVEHPAPFP